MMRKALRSMLLKESGYNYDNYRLDSRKVLGLGVEGMLEVVEWVYPKHLEYRLD